MKKFKYKLEPLLKLRSFNEEKIKVEIGTIVKEITDIKDDIAQMHRDIEESYEAQEHMAYELSSSRSMQFFPYFIQGRKERIKAKENILYALEKKYQAKLMDLAKARGEVKILENLKENQKQEHKKEEEKKLYANVEENFQMRKFFMEKIEGEGS
jgi:flagellar FliJ protein